MRNIRLNLAFDGTNYHGWQRQTNNPTVQEELERAIQRITCEESSVLGCSRTDAGVHAENYVCNFQTHSMIDCFRLPLALNAVMPRDIRVYSATEVPLDFHATLDATEKAYRYLVKNSAHQNPFLRNFAWHYPHAIDLDKIESVLRHFIGTHDFTSFMCTDSEAKTAVRTVKSLSLRVKDDGLLEFEISADGFLYNMVRIIVGTLIYVGNEKIPAEDIPSIILAKDRRIAGITAPAHGLRLYRITYEGGKEHEKS